MMNSLSQRSEKEEEIRLQNAEELMYGNQDGENLLPFDVRARFKYLVYHEALAKTEDGQVYSLKATRRYSFFTPLQWDTLMKERYFERHKKVYKILHDPIAQAKMEGVRLKGYYEHKTGASVKDKLKNVKSALDFAKNEGVQTEETEKVKRGRKEVVNG
jgi:hypothetical protein